MLDFKKVLAVNSCNIFFFTYNKILDTYVENLCYTCHNFFILQRT